MKPGKPNRDFAIDWLRVFAMGVVFLFHCARYFDNEGWHVKNPQSDVVISFFVLFLSQWIMPLFFILSGISTFYALSFRNTGRFIKSRITRLLVPFIFGTFVLILPQVYFERVSHHQFIGFYFIHWNTGVYLKYLALCVASFVSICIIYELLVRRINILRFLFGLKPGIKLMV